MYGLIDLKTVHNDETTPSFDSPLSCSSPPSSSSSAVGLASGSYSPLSSSLVCTGILNHNIKCFCRRVLEFEELVYVGNRLLVGFHQGLEFLRRPPINKTSELIESIFKVNETRRVLTYVEAGCVNAHDNIQNISKCSKFTPHALCIGFIHLVHWVFRYKYDVVFFHCTSFGKYFFCNFLQPCCLISEIGRLIGFIAGKCLVNELGGLVKEVTSAMRTLNERQPHLQDKVTRDEFDPGATPYDKAEMSSSSLWIPEPEVSDYAAMMGIIYSMVKQDYTMQERIISSLNLTLSSEELESYSLMWSLRPFISDEIVHQAWRFMP
ncbi:hypothetical protein U1Q18_004289 [Sarracenia purpurea var. burkii]